MIRESELKERKGRRQEIGNVLDCEWESITGHYQLDCMVSVWLGQGSGWLSIMLLASAVECIEPVGSVGTFYVSVGSSDVPQKAAKLPRARNSTISLWPMNSWGKRFSWI